ncbi:transcription factor KUA1 [Citrus sinensis]|nr:transcription factor KUA1 [Citrus sinensis]
MLFTITINSTQFVSDHLSKLYGLRPGWLFSPQSLNDVSDAQWRNFRSNLTILTMVFALFAMLANTFRTFFNLKARRMSILWLFISFIYLFYLHGAWVREVELLVLVLEEYWDCSTRLLVGLQKLGKGDWSGIARNYVVSRTPTQVASHAQKYFIRQSNVSRRKRRSSLFDIVADEPLDTPAASQDLFSANHTQGETQSNNPLPASPALDEECESMDSTNSNDGEPAPPKPENS